MGFILLKQINFCPAKPILLRAHELSTEKQSLSSKSTQPIGKVETNAHKTAVSLPGVLDRTVEPLSSTEAQGDSQVRTLPWVPQ